MTEMKKQHSLPRVRLMRRAAVIRRNNDMNRRDALIIAHRIGGLIRKMHRENVKFCYTKQDGTVRHAHRISTQFSPPLYATTGKYVCSLLRPRSQRVAHVSCRKFPLRRMSFEEQMRFGEQMSFGQQINFEMSFGQQISFGQQMNFGEQMTSEERKEWETLCRMYHVDSLYEAIQGCREELEFLVRCAERLEPRAEEE